MSYATPFIPVPLSTQMGPTIDASGTTQWQSTFLRHGSGAAGRHLVKYYSRSECTEQSTEYSTRNATILQWAQDYFTIKGSSGCKPQA